MGKQLYKTCLYLTLLEAAMCWEQSLQAQDNQFLANRRSTLPGSRASQMAGAYTALSEDTSGVFYNPAGMAFGKPRNLSISTNGYSERRVTYIGTIGENDFHEKSSSLFPSFIGGGLEWQSFSIAWSLITLDSQSFNQNDRFENISSTVNEARDFNITHQQTSQYQLAGAGFGFRLNKNLAFGTSLFAYRRTLESSSHQSVSFNGGSIVILDRKVDTDNLGWMGQAGIQWRSKHISLGLLLRNFQTIQDQTTVTSNIFTFTDGDNPSGTFLSRQEASGIFDELNPRILKLGIAWVNRVWVTAFDIVYYGPAENKINDSLSVKLLETINYSLGQELILGPIITRLGVFTNFSHFPDIDSTITDQPQHIDFIGSSLGFAYRRKDSEINLGMIYQQGKGKAQKIQGDSRIQNVEASALFLMVGSDYEF